MVGRCDAADRYEILERIERLGLDQRYARRCPAVQPGQGVAIARRRQCRARRRHAARAWLVLDDEALAELLAELLGDDPCRDVTIAAGAERQNDPHRTFGKGGQRRYRAGSEYSQPAEQHETDGTDFHVYPPWIDERSMSSRAECAPPAKRLHHHSTQCPAAFLTGPRPDRTLHAWFGRKSPS
jgi:hypothetical protein